MGIVRLSALSPVADTDVLFHTSSRSSIVSIIATNVGGLSTSISVWAIPSGQDANPNNWVHIAYNVSVEAGNSMETFRFPVVTADKIYIRATTSDVSFSLNSLYESNGVANITVQGTAPESATVGDIWVDSDDNRVYVYNGSSFIDITGDSFPSQSGNSGKYLTTDGTITSWGSIDLSAKADINSPTFTGTPLAPTASAGTNNTQIATTAYVDTAESDAVSTANAYSDSLASNYDSSGSASAVASDLTDHENATTSVHGISNTANLVYTDDSRLSDSRTPTAHASTHGSGGSDAITISQSQVTNLTTDLSGKASLTVDFSTQTDSYTLVLGDAGKAVEMGKATAQTLTVPLNSSVAFPIGTKIDVIQTGAGETTIAATGGVTVNSEDGKLKVNAQWQAVSLIKRATDTWILVGALKA